MLVDASNAREVVERLDELARLLEHGQFARATLFARDLHREADAHLCGSHFDGDYEDGDDE